MQEGQKIRVLVVDDSLVPREMISQILNTDPNIEVIGTARNGKEAVEKTRALRPSLVTMDIHMPMMDGLEATEQIMAYHPTPILVVSSSVHGPGMGRAFDALDAGALEVMKKPEPKDWEDLESVGRDLIRRVKVLSRVKVITHIRGKRRDMSGALEAPARTVRVEAIAIGSSTGGPSALMTILSSLPAELPATILIAQHIADGFVPGLVAWLNTASLLTIEVAEAGAAPKPGTAYMAPTGRNMVLRDGRIEFETPAEGQLYIPSADTLFDSVLRQYGVRSMGVLLTGMGADGARGLKNMRDAGCSTIAQDEATSTVFGMPRAAIEIGAAGKVLPIEAVSEGVLEAVAESGGAISFR